MAGQTPSFLTGANAKIKIGSITLAYAQDVSYRVNISTIPVEAMGRYEVISHEPIAYTVEGSLSIIRYTAAATGAGAAADGNGVGKWNIVDDQTGDAQFNPQQLLLSKTFDLQVFQKENDGSVLSSDHGAAIKLIDCRFTSKGGSVNKRGILTEQFSFNAILMQDDSFTVSRSNASEIDLEA